MEFIVLAILGLAVAVFVLIPLRNREPAHYDWDGTGADTRREERRSAIEAEVLRYRQALRAGTLCTHCGLANEPASRFCGQCGRPLTGTESGQTPAASG